MNKIPKIVYEEEHFFIVNKPAGYYSHPNHFDHHVDSLVTCFNNKIDFDNRKETSPFPEGGDDSNNDHSTYKLRKGLVHRLDRETSGLIIMAKTPQALHTLQCLFRNRQVVKKYLALVHGHFFEQNKALVHKLIRDPHYRNRRKVWVERPIKDSRNFTPTKSFQNKIDNKEKLYKIAEMVASPIKFFQHHTLLDIEIFTGRTHQIRVQLNYEGFPVVGDQSYGKKMRGEPTLLMLCAYFLEFTNPFTDKTIVQKIEPPNYFTDYTKSLPEFQLMSPKSLKR